MTKRWWEYQKALNPVNFLRGFGRLSLFRLNQGVANVNAMAIKITIIIPVTPSTPFTNHQ